MHGRHYEQVAMETQKEHPSHRTIHYVEVEEAAVAADAL
jgi:hypothetical protein